MRAIGKMTIRTIRAFPGRYTALFLIIALSAGFFSGLKLTKGSMLKTFENYSIEQKLYDYRVFSTIGFTDGEVKKAAGLEGIREAEGGKSLDVLIEGDEDNVRAYHLMSLPKKINVPSLEEGRLPAAEGECAADARVFSKEDIGTTLVVADNPASGAASGLTSQEYTIVGIVNSPLYIGSDRGTTDIGNGLPAGFLYIPEEEFLQEEYTEMSMLWKESAKLYSDAYEELADQHKENIRSELENMVCQRFEDQLAVQRITWETARQAGISQPQVYLLTRNENAGYVSFENDTSIVSGIANVFPFFFIMVAMLVCITTMTRMVTEERTQIGVLKALGYSNGAIMAKYLLYAASAAVCGWGAGYFLGTWGIPQIFWVVYNTLYDFAPLEYVFSAPLALSTLAAALAGTLGSTWYCCRRKLLANPARLIRPAAPLKGRRIVLERIRVLWNRMSFLQKVSIRNMFRYRQRLVMMLVGIGGCTALLVTGFGVRDSMLGINDKQFGGVQDYHMDVTFSEENGTAGCERLEQEDSVEDFCSYAAAQVELRYDGQAGNVQLMSFAGDQIDRYFHMRSGEKTLKIPEKSGEALVSSQIAQRLGIQAGDTVELVSGSMHTCKIRIAGVFENYIQNYIVMSDESYKQMFGAWQPTAAFVNAEKPDRLIERLISYEEISSVSQIKTRRDSIEDLLSCLNYVIWLVVFFAGSLSFVVIYNLTNINLAERSREIATVKVLGFYPRETYSYILRENLILSFLAGMLGLPAGTLLHRFVMSRIEVDKLTFPVQVTGGSYIMALILTIVFAYFVNGCMKRRIEQIQMAESLKTVE